MALMRLLRLPTEDELELYHIDFESFYQAFAENQTGQPFTAEVKQGNDGTIFFDIYEIPPCEWFEVI